MPAAAMGEPNLDVGRRMRKERQEPAQNIPQMEGTALRRRYHNAVDPDETVFFIEAESVSLMRRVVEVLLLQVNEINFEITEDSITIGGMESSQIALMDINISKRNFVTYRINRPTAVGMSLNILRDMLKMAGTDDFLRLYKKPDDDYIHMQLFSKKYVTSRLSFKWKTLDIEVDAIQPPETLCTGDPNIILPSWRFKELMGDFKGLSDNVEVNLNPGHLTWHVIEAAKVLDFWVDSRTDGEDCGYQSRVEINCGARNEFKGWKKCFGLKHLDIFSKGASLANRIKIWIHDKHPVCFHYDLENDPDLGWARFWLAPFVDNQA